MKIQVKAFDEEHEEDLESKINEFLEELDPSEFIDIRYSICAFPTPNGDQIFCYSALVIYRD